MKKMYKKPIVEATELRGGFVMNGTSSVVNNNPLPGGSGTDIPEGN